jgi:DNA-directed RNA polymerase specialized sigma24 family protein
LSNPQDPFDALLAWLNSDRDLAALHYETIRSGLIRIFVAKGFSDAEDLADEAISRVCKRLPEIRDGYVGEPALYFQGVARYIILERYRLREIATEVIELGWVDITSRSDLHECLLQCLEFLTPEKHDLILDYFLYEGHDKIEHHRTLAAEFDISVGALRGRVHHIRAKLEKCVLECTQSLRNGTKGVTASIVNSGAGTRSVNHGGGKTKPS